MVVKHTLKNIVESQLGRLSDKAGEIIWKPLENILHVECSCLGYLPSLANEILLSLHSDQTLCCEATQETFPIHFVALIPVYPHGLRG